MEAEMIAKDQRIAVLEDAVSNPPYAFQCAYRDSMSALSADYSVITYDRLTTDEISGGGIYNVTGGLDINTGVFTVGQGYSGVWEVTYTARSWQSSGQAYLYINGEQ